MIRRHVLLLAASLLLPPGQASAQADFPNKAVKVVVTVAPGAASDTVARRLGEHVSKTLGQPVMIDNKPGAQSMIAVRAVARRSRQ